MLRVDRLDHLVLTVADIEANGLGPMRSIYIRDPDRNLIEIAAYGADASGRSAQGTD